MIIGAVKNFRVLSGEELLIEQTEHLMVHGPVYELPQEDTMQALVQSGLISTKTIASMLDLDLDAVQQEIRNERDREPSR